MKTQRFLAFWLFLIGLLLGSSNANAQWGGGGGGGGATVDLPLVSSTNFAAIGYEDSFYVSPTFVNDFEGIIKPTITIGGAYSLPENTAASIDQGTGGKAEGTFLSGKNYGISYNSIQLDSLRMRDEKGEWGIVFSSGNKMVSGNTHLFTYHVSGLKNDGKYKVVIEYCNPHSTAYLNNQSQLNKKSETNGGPYLQSYNTSIKIGTNNKTPDGFDPTDRLGQTAGCKTYTINSPTNPDNRANPISNESLDVNVYMNQSGPFSAIKIKSIKVYAELDPKISGKTSECVGGKNATFKLVNSYIDCTYQWYKKEIGVDASAKAISGATGTSYTHTTGDKEGQEYEFYCEIKTKAGDKVSSNTIKFKDKHCCTDENGNPADEKLIWQDDFGTFTAKGKYWVWDYDDINNPKKVEKTAADGWTYELGYAIPGASYLSEPSGEGTYSVAARVNRDESGTNWSWQCQTFYGKYPSSPTIQTGDDVYKSPNGYAPDHTASALNAPAGYGAMLFLNCGNEPDAVIYSRTIDKLCNKNLTVKCYISNWSASQFPVKIKIRVTDMNSGESKTTPAVTRMAKHDDKTYDVETAWEEVSAEIELTGNEPSLKFEIISEAGTPAGVPKDDPRDQNGQGNDLLLDDIQIWTCTPPSVKLFFDEELIVEDTVSCDGKDMKLFVEETSMIRNYYKNSTGDNIARYIYQYTFDDPSSKTFDKKSWKPVPGSDITKDITYKDVASLFVGKEPDDKVYFRVVLGSEETLNTFGLNYAYNPDEACASYTVSDPIVVTVKCDACTHPKDIKIKADKESSLDKKNKKDIIDLCFGESVTLSQAADITPDESEWASTDFKDNGFVIKWFKNAEEPSTIPANTKGIVSGVVDPIVVSYDDETLGGTEMPVLLYAVDALYPDGQCKTGDTIYIRFKKKPTDELKTPTATFCEGVGAGAVNLKLKDGNASDYTIKWWYGTDTTKEAGQILRDNLTESFFEERTVAESGTYTYQLVDKEAPYCKGDLKEFELTVNAVPDAPTDESIQYTITGKVEQLGTERFNQTVTTDPELLWYTSSDRTVELDQDGKNTVNIDKTVATLPGSPIVYYIAYFNGNCYSDRAKVEVEILAAPKPTVKDLDLCVNGTIDANTGAIADAGYELVWFTDPADTAGTKQASAPNTADFTTPGEYTYYVAQRATTDPYAQSDVAEFKVTVYGVMPPVDKTTETAYCAGETASELKADTKEDKANFYYADALVWVNGAAESPTPYTANTAVVANTKYDYEVYQTYTAPISGDVCKGTSIPISVDVYYVSEPTGQKRVNYTQAEGASGFATIPVKNPQAITDITDPGYTLLWAKDATSLAWCDAANASCDAAKPKYDALALPGSVQKQTRYAKWQQEVVSGKFCESKSVEVEITISSTPPPTVVDIDHCYGYIETTLNTEIAAAATPSQPGYSVYWFANSTDADAAMSNSALLTSTSPDPFVMPATNDSKEVVYYVVHNFHL